MHRLRNAFRALLVWLASFLPRDVRIKVAPPALPPGTPREDKGRRGSVRGRTVEERWRAMLERDGLSLNIIMNEEPPTRRARLVYQRRDDAPGLVLSDDGEAETATRWEALRLADESEVISGKMYKPVGTSGVYYSAGLPQSEDQNAAYEPVIVRGQQYDHGKFHQGWLTASPYRRAFSNIAQGVVTLKYRVAPAEVDADLPGREVLKAMAERQAKWVERVLFEDLYGGWTDFLFNALYFLISGNAVFAEVWEGLDAHERRRGAVKRLQFKYSSLVEEWIFREGTDELVAVKFREPEGDSYVLPAENLLLYAYDSFGGNPEGVSPMRSIIIWIEMLQKASRMEAIALEKYGATWTFAYRESSGLPGMSEGEREKLVDIIDAAVAEENPIIVLPDNTRLQLTSPSGQVPDFEPIKRFCLERILEILKAEGALIGVGETGAFAARMQASAENANFAPYFAQTILRGLNGSAGIAHQGTIRKMVDAHFGGGVDGRYPRVELAMGDDQDPEVGARIVTAAQAGLVQANDDVIQFMHDLYGLPPAQFDEPEAPAVDTATGPALPAPPPTPAVRLADVDPADLGPRLDAAETKLGRALGRVATRHRSYVSGELEDQRRTAAVDADLVERVLAEAAERFLPDYMTAVSGVLGNVADDGVRSLMRERAVRGKSSVAVDVLGDAALSLMVSSVANEAANRQTGLMRDRFVEFARGDRGAALPKLAASTFEGMAARAVSSALNTGREAAVNEAIQLLDAGGDAGTVRAIAERSSVLDNHTCGPCAELDGARALYGSQRYRDISPPNKCEGGGRCRCIFSYILPDEEGFADALRALKE